MRLNVHVPVRWNDLDAYGHVNNAAMFTIVEEARIAAFWRDPATSASAERAAGNAVAEHSQLPTGGTDTWPTAVLETGPDAGIHSLMARQEIEYRRPVPFLREGVVVQLWVTHLGGSSIEIAYSVHDLEGSLRRVGPPLASPPYAVVATTLVLVDARSGRPVRLSAHQRAAWEPFLDEPIVFRHRR